MSKLRKKLLALLGITVIFVLVFAASITRFGDLSTAPWQKLVLVKGPTKAKIDKTDPKWLRTYCTQEAKNLPAAPFKNKGLDGDVHFYNIPSVFLQNSIPKDKWSKTVSCGLWHKFESKEAYGSVGVEYGPDIRLVRIFQENVDNLITKTIQKIDKNWVKVSPLSDSEGGRPVYGYAGFPMVFKRENPDLETVDFATMTFGANNFYMNFSVYEK